MPGELTIPLPTLYGFLLALARVSCVFLFVPIPGVRNGPMPARIVLVLAVTMALSGSWPLIEASDVTVGSLASWLIWEATLGLGVGLTIAVLTEALAVAAQLISVQSGYAFASTIDPNTQADSTVLVIISQLLGGMLFFSLGLDRQLLAAFAQSLQTLPPSTIAIPLSSAERVIGLASSIFTTGLRLAMPIVGLLALIDVALALLGRLNAHLQMLTVSFPAKMLVAVFMLSSTLFLYTEVFSQHARLAFQVAGQLLGR
jgi:flagellar biosynthetic protein FliR